jgi:hypothetical protein
VQSRFSSTTVHEGRDRAFGRFDASNFERSASLFSAVRIPGGERRKTVRITGYVLLVLGIIFELLFVLAALGGGKISPSAYVIAAILIIMGWRMKAYGKGISTRPTPASPSGAAIAEASSVTPSPTVELALTPAVVGLITRETARSRRIMTIVVVVGVVVFLAIGEGIDLAVSSPGNMKAFPMMAIVGLAFGLIVGGIWFATLERPVRRDLRESTYLRTSGPIQIVPMFGGNMLRLADRAFLMNGRSAAAELAKLNWATVDYSKHAHVILGASDQSGNAVYSVAGYAAGAARQS